MTPSMASRCAGTRSGAANPGVGAAATSAPPSAQGTIRSRRDMATKTPATKGDRRSELLGILDLLRLTLNRFGAIVGGGVLGQQRLGADGLLGRVLFFPGGESFLGQSESGHAKLVVAAIGRRQQMPAGGLLVFGAQCVVEIGNGALVHLRITRFDVDLRERNPQQRRPGSEAHRFLVGLRRFGNSPVLE